MIVCLFIDFVALYVENTWEALCQACFMHLSRLPNMSEDGIVPADECMRCALNLSLCLQSF